ncbi:MAG: hypothetical protein ACHQK9_13130 [Reyranellales bacterium]
MRNYRQPMHPVVKNMLILLSSGLVASVLCAKVYGATLPLDEPVTASAPSAPISTNDAVAAASLRAMLASQRPAAVEPTVEDKPRR